MELKREFLQGELAHFSKVVLPAVGAIGGMLVPALIYAAVNISHKDVSEGWAVPVATDIAFALGVLSLFGRRVPVGLKLFLMALAIFDDVGAILIIAFFYADTLSYLYLGLAAVCLSLLGVLNKFQRKRLSGFLLVGFLLWFFTLKSGIHPTVAGVLLAIMMPLNLIRGLEKKLHPWVAFGIMPLFALANAGVSFAGLEKSMVFDTVFLGIVFGLLIGKPLGVFCFTWVWVKMGRAVLPHQVNWSEMMGVAVLCGIGFTMSLFLGTLAFQHKNSIYLTEVRLAVLAGSLFSGLVGSLILWHVFKRRGGTHAP